MQYLLIFLGVSLFVSGLVVIWIAEQKKKRPYRLRKANRRYLNSVKDETKRWEEIWKV